MIDERCLGPDIDRSKISPEAEVSGASYLTGSRTAIAPGAIVRDTRLHDAAIDSHAAILDSILVADGKARSHKCDNAGRTVVSGTDRPRLARGALVSGSTLVNVAVGERSRLSNTWAGESQIGSDNVIADAKLILVNTEHDVAISGPTDVSEAYLAHHTVIDRRGYFEGKFSSSFRQLKFNASTHRLEVVGEIDLPHVSRYGFNTVNSTNSGKVLPQPGGVLKGLGPHLGLWKFNLLSHEQLELGPCCWVAPWTKVVGQSATPHQSNDEMVNDELMTYIMPFALAGFGGDITRGLVMPGELSLGLGSKNRKGAWVFTYSPEAVINMVHRLHEALEPDRKKLADTIVVEAIKTALEMTKALADRNKVDLSVPTDKQRTGWGRWVSNTYQLLDAHLTGELWQFEAGRPKDWRTEGGKWTHPRIDRVLAIAPDALDKQVSEKEIFTLQDPVPPISVALPTGTLKGTAGEPEFHPDARISPTAIIAPGCRIDSKTIIADGAVIWNSVLTNCKVGKNARIERSRLSDSEIGDSSIVRSCKITESSLGEHSVAQSASLVNSHLAGEATINAFADLVDVKTEYASILGGRMHSAKIETYLMSMHMAGTASHLIALPTRVEVAGLDVPVPAVPMIGGGALIRGSAEAPVQIESCFIGSNAIIEAGTYVGFGCFILGRLGPNAGLLPFTVSTGDDPQKHQIGAVLGSLACMIVTHFLEWTYQSVTPEDAPAVAELVPQSIQRAIDAIDYELTRRSGKANGEAERQFACYRSLPDYSDEQLQRGLDVYRRVLDSGAWQMVWDGEQLKFSSDRGFWAERNGVIFWKAGKSPQTDS